MATRKARNGSPDVTVQTKITEADSHRFEKEIERWRKVNPCGDYSRSSILRMALLTWLAESESLATAVSRAMNSDRRRRAS